MEDIQMTSQGDFLASKITSSARPANIDMALDDVIMSNTRDRPRHRHGRGSTRGDDRKGRSTGAGIRKPRDHGRRSDRNQSPPRRSFGRDQPSRRSQGRSSRHVVRNDGPLRVSIDNGPKEPQSRLQVSNLHHEVTAEDLRDLFATVAAVDRVNLQFDMAGRSNGVAVVTFFGRNDAGAVADRFHNIPLDGMPMRIELMRAPEGSRRPRPDSERGERWSHDGFFETNGEGRRNQDRQGDRRGGRRPSVSAASLDDELDAYMMKK